MLTISQCSKPSLQKLKVDGILSICLNKTPNATNDDGGLSSTLWTCLLSLSLWHDSKVHSIQLPHDKQWVRFRFRQPHVELTTYLWGCSYATQRSVEKSSVTLYTLRYSAQDKTLYNMNWPKCIVRLPSFTVSTDEQRVHLVYRFHIIRNDTIHSCDH